MMDLKPCPFCGNPKGTKPEVVRVSQAFDLGNLHEDKDDFIVRCEWCGSCGEGCCNPNAAIKAWNTRHDAG